MSKKIKIGWIGATGRTYTVTYGDLSGGVVTNITGITSDSLFINIDETKGYSGYVETICLCRTPKQYFSILKSNLILCGVEFQPYYPDETDPLYETLSSNVYYDLGTTSGWSIIYTDYPTPLTSGCTVFNVYYPPVVNPSNLIVNQQPVNTVNGIDYYTHFEYNYDINKGTIVLVVWSKIC